jgi:5'(3')-deoxyribonucleotidase
MNNKIIAVDIDEVLSETLKSMLKKHRYTINHRKIAWEDLTNYNIWDIESLGLSKKQAIRMFATFQL